MWVEIGRRDPTLLLCGADKPPSCGKIQRLNITRTKNIHKQGMQCITQGGAWNTGIELKELKCHWKICGDFREEFGSVITFSPPKVNIISLYKERWKWTEITSADVMIHHLAWLISPVWSLVSFLSSNHRDKLHEYVEREEFKYILSQEHLKDDYGPNVLFNCFGYV